MISSLSSFFPSFLPSNLLSKMSSVSVVSVPAPAPVLPYAFVEWSHYAPWTEAEKTKVIRKAVLLIATKPKGQGKQTVFQGPGVILWRFKLLGRYWNARPEEGEEGRVLRIYESFGHP